jgi:formamidopyrimidine-DNA glycosylase
MPELPEVELISRSLSSLVTGRHIIGAELLRPRLAPDIASDEFAARLKGSTISRIDRRGKHILFHLSNNNTLIVHLRMSGRFSLLRAGSDDPKFTHAVFHFDDEERRVFDDQRHFGLMKVVPTAEVFNAKELSKLAPEPFSDGFSIAYFRAALKGSKRTLKEFLIDQTKVCGLGNIYACEAMFAAGVDPRKVAAKLSGPKAALLHASIIAVLKEAVSHADGRPVDPETLEGNY